MRKDYREAIPLLREDVSRAQNSRSGHLWLAATYAQLGRLDEAREEAAEVLRIEPKWSIEGTSRHINVFKHPEHTDHFFDGIRKGDYRKVSALFDVRFPRLS
jgi:adenylate cyclase